jgi:integrase
MGVYQRDGRWLVYWNENGKRRDKSFGSGDNGKYQAEMFDAAVKTAKSNNQALPDPSFVQTYQAPVINVSPMSYEPVQPVATVETGSITFGKLAQKYLEHLSASGKTEKHILTIANLLKTCFFTLLSKTKCVDTMTYVDDILPFIKHFQGVSSITGKPRSQITVNRYCDYVDAIFNFGIENELSKINPMSKRKRSKERPRDVQLNIEDMKKIMEKAEPHLKWAMEVCFNLGTRPGESELLSLKWSNVDFTKATVRIYATKTKTFRTVPIKVSFLEKLKSMREYSASDYIVDYKGHQIKSLKGSFRTASEHAGIKYPVRLYDLRHLFATTLLSNSADLAAVSKLMGHATVKMTADTYYHYLEGEKERAVSMLPDIA